MAYSLEALIGKDAFVIVPQLYPAAQVVRLRHGLQMLPLTRAFTSELRASRPAEQTLPWEEMMKTRGLPSWFEKRNDIVADLASQLSEVAPVAYVEANFFGGVGGQSALIWQQRQIVFARSDTHGIGAINEALRYLGVQASNTNSWFDEFMMVGLGQKRDTEQWGT
ncbi:MAG TPA: hypothetical protein VH593_07545 [Ktedonobacteraceae bacterium]|jgi:hypothetical protein